MKQKKIINIILVVLLISGIIFGMILVYRGMNTENTIGISNTENTSVEYASSSSVGEETSSVGDKEYAELKDCMTYDKDRMTYTNLDFSKCSFEPIENMQVDEMYKLKARQSAGDISEERKKELYDDIYQLYMNVLGQYEEKPIDSFEYEFYLPELLESMDEKYDFCLSRLKTFEVTDESRYIFPVDYQGKRKKVYRIADGDDISEVYSEKIGMSLEKAIELCNQCNEKYMKDYEIGDGLIISSAYWFVGNDDREEYIIRYLHSYKGVGLNDAGSMVLGETGYISVNWLEYAVDNKGISSVRSYYGKDIYETEKLDDNFLTLEAAANVLSEYLAPYGKYHVESVSVNYCLLRYNGIEKLEFVPMWSFRVKTGEMNAADIDPRIVMYVDMVTGKVYVSDAIDNKQWFNINPNIEE